MTAQKLKSSAVVSYRFQRYYPKLQTSHYLSVQTSQKQLPAHVTFFQGKTDGCCGLMVFLSLLVIFDLAKSSALENLSRRKHGVPAIVWSAFQHTYFSGVHADEFVALVDSLKLPLNLTLRESKQGDLDRWVVDCLMRGEIVAIVTANAKNSKFKHWSLALGVEGMVAGRETKPDTILLLDPSASEPSYRPHNSRLRVPITGLGSRAGKSADELGQSIKGKATSKPIHWLYESGDFATEQVRLVSAVRFRYADWT
jgi:hypothetical protein